MSIRLCQRSASERWVWRRSVLDAVLPHLLGRDVNKSLSMHRAVTVPCPDPPRRADGQDSACGHCSKKGDARSTTLMAPSMGWVLTLLVLRSTTSSLNFWIWKHPCEFFTVFSLLSKMSSGKQVLKMFFETIFPEHQIHKQSGDFRSCTKFYTSYLHYKKLQHTTGLVLMLALPTAVSKYNCIYIFLTIGGRVPS